MKQTDIDIAKISRWCVDHGFSCHVSLSGDLELRKKSDVQDGQGSAPDEVGGGGRAQANRQRRA